MRWRQPVVRIDNGGRIMHRPWLVQYPQGVPAEIAADTYPSLVALMEESFQRHRDQPAYRFMGRAMSFGEWDEASQALAAWLQAQGLQRGDRVAVMLPNVPQYPIAVAAILRAGLVVVNVNPLYTPRELEHQLKDSGARVIVILENFAATLEKVLDHVPVKRVLLAALGDRLGWLKGTLVNQVVRRVKKLVPPYRLPMALRFNEALARGRGAKFAAPPVGPDDIAVLQYTGGTTGASKGAVLLHRNLVANVLQSEAWNQPSTRCSARWPITRTLAGWTGATSSSAWAVAWRCSRPRRGCGWRRRAAPFARATGCPRPAPR